MSSPSNFPLELDHLVIFSAVDAPEATALEAAGVLGFGGATKHGELGTASTSFFFTNTYLELFWVCDDAQVVNFVPMLGSDPRQRMNWRSTGASPFSLALRRKAGALGPLPYPSTRLPAVWMPGDFALEFMTPTIIEPACGIIPPPLQYQAWQSNIPPQSHPLGAQTLTNIHITTTHQPLSSLAAAITQSGIATIASGAEHLLTLTFDGGAQGKMVDLRPTLPLVLRA